MTADALLLPDRQAAALCGCSRAHWHRLRVAGKLPAPLRLGRKVLWRAEELREWVAAGCPDARSFTGASRSRSESGQLVEREGQTIALSVFRFLHVWLPAILLFLYWHVVKTGEPLSDEVLLVLVGTGAGLIFLLRSWRKESP